jgi:hypothetical protein
VQASEEWRLHYSHEPISMGSPPAGQPLTRAVPGAIEWEIQSISFTYTASAGVANRIPFVQFLDTGGGIVCEVATPFLLVANNAARVTFGVGVQQFGANSAVRIGAGIPLLRLGDGMRVRLGATAQQAADTITGARMFVRQWTVRPL